jgi:malonyl CoA-acyl carrier protein transacylase
MIKNVGAAFCSARHSRLFLFAGQGTQEVGMLQHIPEQLREEHVSRASKLLGVDLAEITNTDEHNQIGQTELTQPLLLLSHYLHFRKENYHETLSKDDWMIGHSLG